MLVRNRVVQMSAAAAALFSSATIAGPAVAQTVTATPGVTVVAPPPATFSPFAASRSASAAYAIPPAPDATKAPVAFQKWQKAMTAIQNRKATVLQPTHVANGPTRQMAAPVIVGHGVATATSGNWSGTAVTGGTFSSQEAIIAEYVVPTARQAFGTCTGSWSYSSQWPGIDGYGSSDVLQAGTEADAYCDSSQSGAYYSAWVEWYPYNETRVSAPAVTPGDVLFVEVWSTSTTTGYAYFYNNSTQESAEYALTAPSGTYLQSNSVEWIVERPSVNNALSTLTNYVATSWPAGYAWDYNDASPTYYFESAYPGTGTINYITMLDDAGSGISSATGENYNFLYFTNFGSAL